MSKYGKYSETVRFYLVDVKDITPVKPRSQFQENELEQLAHLMLTTGCLLRPLVLRQNGPMSYELLEGHLEYWSAVKAKEKEPILAEMVSAFVVKPEVETVAIQQAQMLNKTISTTEIKTVSTSSSSSESRINDLESRLERELQEIKAVQVQNTQRLEDVIRQSQLQILEVLNTLKAKESENILKPSVSTISQRNREEVESEVLNALNNWGIDELLRKLGSIRSIKKIANSIIEQRPFQDLSDVVKRTNGLGKETMAKIIAAWTK